MTATATLLALLLLAQSGGLSAPPRARGGRAASPAASVAPAGSPAPADPAPGPVILFLMDNSASLAPLDPNEKRVEALNKMVSYVEGQPYRLILFGGRREIAVDDPARYRNDGQWTDFYFALLRAREITREYPAGTEFRIILLTDAIFDPNPRDWEDQAVPAGDLRAAAHGRLLDLLREMGIPLYVILVGELPTGGYREGDPERTPYLILDMIRAANGAAASPAAQTLSSFFKDDGLLLKKFVFRVEPGEGLKKVEPVVRRISAPPRPSVELQFFTFGVLPLTAILFVLVGALVRSFPGPGDLEVIELSRGEPVHVAADRLHRVEGGGWSSTGLSRVLDAREAAATFTYQAPSLDLTGMGLDTEGLEPLAQRLLPLGLEELRRELETMAETGGKDEKIFALNLDYMAKNLDAAEAERVLTASPGERRLMGAMDFLRAKAHLAYDDDLRRKLTEPRVLLSAYGRSAERKEITTGSRARIGRYGFVVQELAHGGRKDVRLVLYYDRVPSLLGLKTVLPDLFQRAFRLRRSSQRVVT